MKLYKNYSRNKCNPPLLFASVWLKKAFLDSLGYTALFAGGIKKEDSIYVDQRNRVLSMFGAEDGNEFDATV